MVFILWEYPADLGGGRSWHGPFEDEHVDKAITLIKFFGVSAENIHLAKAATEVKLTPAT